MSAGFALLDASIPPIWGKIVLSLGTQILGRSSECRIVIDDPSISRKHAAITLDRDQVVVKDLGSRNGTFIERQRIEQKELLPDQVVSFGSVSFLLKNMASGQVDSDDDTASHDMMGRPISAGPSLNQLTEAQRGVFDLLLSGRIEKEIASRLKISPHTVHAHIRAIYRAFGVHSRPELFSVLYPKPDPRKKPDAS